MLFFKNEFWDLNKQKRAFRKSFNLFEMSVGSVHYDQELREGNNFFGKLIFDIKMSQIVNFEIQMASILCELKEPLTNRKYFYNFVITVRLKESAKNNRKRKFEYFRE